MSFRQLCRLCALLPDATVPSECSAPTTAATVAVAATSTVTPTAEAVTSGPRTVTATA